MKKPLPTPLIPAILLTYVFTTGCLEKDAPLEAKSPVVTIQQTFEEGSLFEGRVVIESVSEHVIGIALNGSEIAYKPFDPLRTATVRDQNFDRIIRFRSEQILPKDLFYSFDDAQLLLSKKNLLIAAPREGIVLGFSIEDSPDPARLFAPIAWSEDPVISKREEAYFGFEIAQRVSGSGWDASRLDLQKARDASTTIFEMLGVGDMFSSPLSSKTMNTCHSGGPGASSCSTSCPATEDQCSVSCNGAFYACCNKFTCNCTCIPIKPE